MIVGIRWNDRPVWFIRRTESLSYKQNHCCKIQRRQSHASCDAISCDFPFPNCYIFSAYFICIDNSKYAQYILAYFFRFEKRVYFAPEEHFWAFCVLRNIHVLTNFSFKIPGLPNQNKRGVKKVRKKQNENKCKKNKIEKIKYLVKKNENW
jgi:hypothetical protein